jgi:hypothetical protein
VLTADTGNGLNVLRSQTTHISHFRTPSLATEVGEDVVHRVLQFDLGATGERHPAVLISHHNFSMRLSSGL